MADIDKLNDQIDKRIARDSPNAFWVCIGASAGGVEAIHRFTKELSAAHEATYLIAQHMAPQHKNLLSEIIAHKTDLTVIEATDNLEPCLGKVYIMPLNHDVIVEDGRIRVCALDEQSTVPKPSVDLLLTSLAKDQKEKAIGIIFSGTGTDGSKGIVEVSKAGGITVAQDEHTSKYMGMPQAAIDTGSVDIVISPEELGSQFGLLLANPNNLSALSPPPISTEGLAELNHLLYQQTNVDFSEYKIGTVQRRVGRRIAAVNAANVHEYVEIARASKQEVNELFKDLMITVTSFFRDPVEFDGLRNHIKKIVRQNPKEMRRVWIAGVATGEEAYTIAILFAEAFGGLSAINNANFQIFATDIDEEAINIARKGYYAEPGFAAVTEQFVDDYFSVSSGGFTVIKSLREKIVFSVHNVITDPPFLNIDIVSCRNLLIYFQSSLQTQVFERFYYALKDHGLLFLGKSEAIVASQSQSLFRAAVPEKHLFVQQPGFKRRLTTNKLNSIGKQQNNPKVSEAQIWPSADPIQRQLETLIAALGPNALVLDENMNIVRIYGELHYFSDLNPEQWTTANIDSLIKQPWIQEIKSAVPGVLRNQKYSEGLIHKDLNNDNVLSRVQIYPLDDGANAHKLALVTVKQWEKTHSSISDSANYAYEITLEETIAALTRELEVSKTNFQRTIDKLETSNQELQALNEELQSDD